MATIIQHCCNNEDDLPSQMQIGGGEVRREDGSACLIVSKNPRRNGVRIV